MKIALLAPIEVSVPPKKYGGTETVVYNLAEALHAQGHDVTVFASGDSVVSCKLVALAKKAIGSGISKRLREAMNYEAIVKASQIIAKGDYDIVHNHAGWQALLFKDLFKKPIITTIHWTLNETTESEMYGHYKDMPFVSISNQQRTNKPDLNYVATIYHGLNPQLFRYTEKPQDYLAFLGRFSPIKGPVEAIRVAQATGQRLIMAAKINDFERKYYETEILPHIDGKQIQYIGEIDRMGTIDLLGNAKALLSPIQWDEPFGLTNIEAMACGTPVIAMNRGSLPEIIIDKKTGFLCKNENEMIESVGLIKNIDRQACRDHVIKNFSNDRMAKDYVALYEYVMLSSVVSFRPIVLNKKELKKQPSAST